MLKVNLDQQQKFKERQEKLVMEWNKKQLEFQQFTLQKTTTKTLWRITRKFIKWLKKALKETRYFPRLQSITRLKHSNTDQRTTKRSRLFTGAMKIFSTIKLLSELFGPNTTLFHKRCKCLNTAKDNQQDFLTFSASVNKFCNDFKQAELTSVWHAMLDCLSSTESIILSIWFCMYSFSSYRYMLVLWDWNLQASWTLPALYY